MFRFLKAGGYKSVDAITWHQYYVNGRTASVDQFLNSTILDGLAVEMRTVRQRTRRYTHQTDFPVENLLFYLASACVWEE